VRVRSDFPSICYFRSFTGIAVGHRASQALT
jgi:hypothetical protein